MSRWISLFVALSLVALAGCATLRGMAQDAENLGKGLKKTIAENDSGSPQHTQ
jgi:predicted small secreted protein